MTSDQPKSEKAEDLFWTRVLRGIAGERPEVTDEEVAYYRAHPDEIDLATSPSRIHRVFLLLGSVAGLGTVVLAKVVAAAPAEEFVGDFLDNLFVDLLFEVGVALIGASVTAYLLGVLLTSSQRSARAWRQALRRRIREGAEADSEP